jgi:hypothetical protein
VNPPPFGLPETLYLFDSTADAPPGFVVPVALAWDGEAWVGTVACHGRNLGCETY